jgi:2-methylisocitrate lyase-like PEP mutase family enzyme
MAEIDVSALSQKAERLRALHHTGRILVLPNIWDPGGARMMESLGYPAVATASASIAYALGYDDGQQITLEAMLDVVGRVASSVHVPVTADMEWGYAEEPRSRFAPHVVRCEYCGIMPVRGDGTFVRHRLACDVLFPC